MKTTPRNSKDVSVTLGGNHVGDEQQGNSSLTFRLRMRLRMWRDRVLLNEDLNFLLTNRIPRIALTHFVGQLSRIENPLLARLLIGGWRLFTDLDLRESRLQAHEFKSMRDCFIRELKPGLRPVESNSQVLTSPCDAIVGACGAVNGTEVIQAKGFPYSLHDLLGNEALVERYRNGCYVTLRLTSTMYHRFHAPHDCTVGHVTYISGDAWNVNPVALKRVERLFCKNERAVIQVRLEASNHDIALVPIAAVLVASIKLHWLDVLLHLKYRGPNEIPCNAKFAKGQEMGWFEHGSTIIVFAPAGFTLCEGLQSGSHIRMGQSLMQLPS
jgi:phosphatidylserine decarboxylase